MTPWSIEQVSDANLAIRSVHLSDQIEAATERENREAWRSAALGILDAIEELNRRYGPADPDLIMLRCQVEADGII